MGACIRMLSKQRVLYTCTYLLLALSVLCMPLHSHAPRCHRVETLQNALLVSFFSLPPRPCYLSCSYTPTRSERLLSAHMLRQEVRISFHLWPWRAPPCEYILTPIIASACPLSVVMGAKLYLAVFWLCVLFAGGENKVFRGTVSSRRAWEENGQFVTKFCFHGTSRGCVLNEAQGTLVACL